MIIPSTTVSVYRTPDADVWDVPGSEGAPVITRLPAWIEETERTTFDRASGQQIVVNKATVLLRPRVFEFTETDQIKDDQTGRVYEVETVGRTSGFMDLNIELGCRLVR